MGVWAFSSFSNLSPPKIFAFAILTSKLKIFGLTLSKPAWTYVAPKYSCDFKENSPPNFGIIISAYYSVGFIIDS